jgi:N-dimethylarginine dimethylaminohydrolase
VKLNSHDEWGRLREAVLGTVENFAPPLELSIRDEGLLDRARGIVARAYPSWYLDEVAEDLEQLRHILEQAGVNVVRPRWREAHQDFHGPNWSASGFDIYNVRDLHAVFGDALVVSASASRFRIHEHHAMQEIFYDRYFEAGMRWIYAPPPRLVGDYLEAYQRERTVLEQEEDSAHAALSGGLSETFHRLAEHEILFDAANVIRIGEDVLFLVSSTGNRLAGRWLQEILGSSYRVHVTNAYRSSHLDSTILPLRPGLVLLNSARVSTENCPEVFERWEKMYFSDVVPVPESEISFHRDVRLPVHHELQSLGVGSALEHISSPWAGLNVLSLDAETVLVHDMQKPLIEALERKGMTVIPVRMRHCYSMLGGLHCSTLDTVRDGELADFR